MTTARPLMELGEAEGKAEGKAEGRRATLHRQLRLKFGSAVTPELAARLDDADDARLDPIEEQILTAISIEQLPT